MKLKREVLIILIVFWALMIFYYVGGMLSK